VVAAIDAADAASRDGRWVAGFVAYDAAPAFDDALRVATSRDASLPLAWFGVFATAQVTGLVEKTSPSPRVNTSWNLAHDAATYQSRVEAVRGLIRAGEVYQVNLTTRATCEGPVDPTALYHHLLATQQPTYGALVATDDFAIVSASPELFFEWRDATLRCRPMKGTQRRGRYEAEDAALAAALLDSPKEQSENVMIVDLVRNDMGKVARVGSVVASSLLDLETYPQVHQLVSEVRCVTTPDTRLVDVFGALFPCGSVTGAPKARAMSVIADLEDSPRGAYCGAVGLLAPGDHGVHATFNVAIRTATVVGSRAEFGTGGGVVYDSDPAREFAETVLKAQQLSTPLATYRLLETFRHDPPGDAEVSGRHLDRLRRSAARLGFLVPADLDDVVRAALTGRRDATRVRVLVDRSGAVDVETAPMPLAVDAPVRLRVDDRPVSSTEPLLFHKTDSRERYDSRRRRFPDADDVVMVNERGECTEVTTANLLVRREGVWWTPPLASGCLPGVARARALERGEVIEHVIYPGDLATADEVAVLNSLRGWRRAVVADEL
jgi:para-aminobenzoate synthetase / 4-amino-4-deoxychorismate lyase